MNDAALGAFKLADHVGFAREQLASGDAELFCTHIGVIFSAFFDGAEDHVDDAASGLFGEPSGAFNAL